MLPKGNWNWKNKEKTYADFDVVIPLVPVNIFEKNIFEN